MEVPRTQRLFEERKGAAIYCTVYEIADAVRVLCARVCIIFKCI